MSRPSASSSASSLRTVDGETPRPDRSARLFDPTGTPVATYSSTTSRRISPCRCVSSRSMCRSVRKLRLRRGARRSPRHRDAGRAASTGGSPPARVRRPSCMSRSSASASIAAATSASGNGSSRRRPSIKRSRTRTSSSRSSGSLGGSSPVERAARYAGKSRPVSPTRAVDRRDGADTDTEVVASEPVREVVARSEVPSRLDDRQKFAVSYHR